MDLFIFASERSPGFCESFRARDHIFMIWRSNGARVWDTWVPLGGSRSSPLYFLAKRIPLKWFTVNNEAETVNLTLLDLISRIGIIAKSHWRKGNSQILDWSKSKLIPVSCKIFPGEESEPFAEIFFSCGTGASTSTLNGSISTRRRALNFNPKRAFPPDRNFMQMAAAFAAEFRVHPSKCPAHSRSFLPSSSSRDSAPFIRNLLKYYDVFMHLLITYKSTLIF